MKSKIFFLTLISTFFLLPISCNNMSGKKHEIKNIPTVNNKNSKLNIPSNLENQDTKGYISSYLNIKNLLVNDDIVNSSDNWIELNSNLDEIPITSFSLKKQEEIKKIIIDIKNIINKTDLNLISSQRNSFELISNKILTLIKLVGSKIKLYQHYCPMFNKNKGGMWISSSEEIFNPLFGSSMLKCGYVKSEIN